MKNTLLILLLLLINSLNVLSREYQVAVKEPEKLSLELKREAKGELNNNVQTFKLDRENLTLTYNFKESLIEIIVEGDHANLFEVGVFDLKNGVYGKRILDAVTKGENNTFQIDPKALRNVKDKIFIKLFKNESFESQNIIANTGGIENEIEITLAEEDCTISNWYLPNDLLARSRKDIAILPSDGLRPDYLIRYIPGSDPARLGFYERKLTADSDKTVSTNYHYTLIPKRKFSPLVGRTVGFFHINGSTQWDKITLNASFDNSANLELGALFTSALGLSGSTQSDPEIEESLEEGDTEIRTQRDEPANLVSTKQQLTAQRDALMTYWQYLSEGKVTTIEYKVDIDYIRIRIKKCYGINEVLTAEKLLELMAGKVQELEERDQHYFNKIKDQAISYYRAILGYQFFNPLIVQIKNADTFKYHFEHTKGQTIETAEFEADIRGGFKIDFSAGLMFTKLIDRNFQVLDSDHTTMVNGNTIVHKEIRQKGAHDMNIGAGVMAHAHSRSGGFINPSLSIGFTLESGQAVNYLLGGSLIIGKQQRLVISGGATYGEVNRLKSKFNVPLTTVNGVSRLVLPETEVSGINDADLVIKKGVWRPFFAITFNFAEINSIGSGG